MNEVRDEIKEVLWKYLDKPTEPAIYGLMKELGHLVPPHLQTKYKELCLDLEAEINQNIAMATESSFTFGYRCGRNPDLLIFQCLPGWRGYRD